MINAVLLNDDIQKNLFEINFAIIYISEKTFYQKEENPFYKRYLCKIISDLNENIKNKEFWYQLLQIRINITIEEEINNRIKKIIKEENKKNNIINNNNTNEKKKTTKKFFGFGIPNIVGNLFGNNITPEEKEFQEKEKIRKKKLYEKIYSEINDKINKRFFSPFFLFFY